MKITKRQLKRIIREEKARMLTEQNVPQRLLEDLFNAMQAIVDATDESNAINIIRDEMNGFIAMSLDSQADAEDAAGAEGNEADEKFSWGIDPKRYHKLRKGATDRRRQALSHLPGGNKE